MSFLKSSLIVTLLSVGSISSAETIKYSEQNHAHDVFKVKKINSANYSYTYMPFNEWKKTASGKNSSLEPAPALRGAMEGVSAGDSGQPVDPSKYQDQAEEFAAHVNFRLEGGRPTVDLGEKTAIQALKDKYKATHVVEMTMSALIDVPFNQIDLSPEAIKNLAQNIDFDHYHFQIPGSLVAEAIEDSHISRKTLDNKKSYLLSVFDLRDYGCAVMRNGIDDYFKKRPAKDRLANGSIYVISDITLNDKKDMKRVTQALGKKPTALISQKVMYADHLIRASSQSFAFYKEGENTRIVLISNVAMGSKFFTGTKGSLIRSYLLEGIGSGITGKVLDSKAGDIINSLLFDAENDVNDKNSCDNGLALGLVGFSQSLFNEFYGLLTE